MKFLDTESVGFSGPLVLIQTKELNGEYVEHRVWETPVYQTLDLIESLMHEDTLIIFNARHEAFVLNKWYNVFLKVANKTLPPIASEIREIEESLNYSTSLCLRPPRILDFYVILRQTIFSFAVGRQKRPIEIKKVPVQAAKPLKNILEKLAVQLPSILFHKYTNKLPGDYWEVNPTSQPGFVDFKLNFNPSLGLKSIIKFLFPEELIQTIEIPKYHQPNEDSREYIPWNDDWPRLLGTHLKYWSQQKSRDYAKKDVLYLEWIHKLLVEKNLLPKDVHIDSDLAWHNGASQFRGFCLDLISLERLLQEAKDSLQNIPDTSPQAALAWLRQAAPPDQQWLIQNTDTKKTLIPLSQMNELGEVASRAQRLIDQRSARKRIELLEKLKVVGRFHPSFEVSGTLSNRMSGSGGINPQGINRDKEIREIFLMADEDGWVLSGGDFSAQEITILEAVINDPTLRELLTKNKKGIHNLMAQCLYSSEDNPNSTPSKDQYAQAKQTVFAYVYGAQLPTLAKSAQVSVEQVKRAVETLETLIPGLKRHSQEIFNDFCSMRQPKGIGSQVEWHEPKNLATSLFGFSRSYVLDNRICKFIYDLANNIPKEFKEIKDKVVRKDREQSIAGAVQSALFASAFAIQAENLRTAGNHKIQNPGATVTKILQHNIWKLQPIGVNKWCIQLYNVHDELLCVNRNHNQVKQVVDKTISILRSHIPLLAIDWKEDIGSWAEVKE